MTNQTQNKFIYLPIYLSDYVSQSRKLTMIQRGALVDLSVLYLQENLIINYSKEQIYRLVFAFSKDEQDAVDFILENYFTKTQKEPMGFNWVSNELNQIAEKILKRLNSSRENGKKGGRKNKEENKPMGLNLLNPNDNPNDNPDDNPDESILNEIKLNQIKEKEIKLKSKSKLFVKPMVDEIKNYCLERKNNINPESFFDYYEARGWKLKSGAIKDWKACVRTWEKNNFKTNSTNPSQTYYKKNDDLDQYDHMINFSKGGKNGI